MSRLTKKNENVCELCPGNQCQGNCRLVGIYAKLAHYEDLEEQGRLIEQKHGHWEKQQRKASWGMTTDNICSVCHEKCWLEYDYCPNCGAKMDEVEE